MSADKPAIPAFDAAVRAVSSLSLLWAMGVFLLRALSTDPGISFVTHISLILAFIAQLALLILFVASALVLLVLRRLRCSKLGAGLGGLAALALVGQYYVIQTIAIDGSTVP